MLFHRAVRTTTTLRGGLSDFFFWAVCEIAGIAVTREVLRYWLSGSAGGMTTLCCDFLDFLCRMTGEVAWDEGAVWVWHFELMFGT